LSLTQVLQQCEEVDALVSQTMRSLSAVDLRAKPRVDSQALASTEDAVRADEARLAMQRAAETLSAVVRTLKREISERRLLDLRFAAAVEQEEGGRHASLHDSLTGLPNRTLLQDRLQHGIAQAKRSNWTLALMFIDLDDFKAINDRHGHAIGDSVLRTVAHRLRHGTRSGDTVGRHGGDEFVYLALDIQNQANIFCIAEKLSREIRAPFDVTIHGALTSLSVKASIGIAAFPQNGTDVDALLTSADRAMYLAKSEKCGYAFAQ
jgi:diguanylate cyclase (GGDEF)-like protein